jgi:hypothetical protein
MEINANKCFKMSEIIFSELFYHIIIYNKMSYTNGNEYIIKSMNGIKTFDDGSGQLSEMEQLLHQI